MSSSDLKRPLTETELQELADNWDNNEDDQIPDETNDSDDDYPDECSEHPSDSDQDASEDNIEEDSGDEQVQSANCFYFKDKSIRWRKTVPPINVRTRKHNIVSCLPIVRQSAKTASTPLEIFSLFFDQRILDLLVKYTNIYISSMRINFERERDANDVSHEEMQAFIGLLILSGVLKSSHLNFEELWAKDGTGCEMFSLTMSSKRFLFLLRTLRFDDLATREERKQTDKLAAVREFIDILLDNFCSSYSTGAYVTIDEQLIPFRGRCSFRQYLPNKPSKYGIKVFAMVDSRTFYLKTFEIYVGVQPVGPYRTSNSPTDVVKRLVQPIKNTNRNVTTDNWYTSIPLVRSLLTDYKLTMVGTLRKNKKEIPKEFLPHRTRPAKSSLFGFTEDITMVSYVPKTSKSVILVSSMHHDDKIDEATGDLRKPELVTFYNCTKAGVDVLDQLCSTYNVGRRTNRWTLAIFFHFLNVAAHNALVIYKAREAYATNIKRRLFLKQLSKELVKSHQISRSSSQYIPRHLRKRIRIDQGLSENVLRQPNVPGPSRGRCSICPRKNDNKYSFKCSKCNNFICKTHTTSIICIDCDDSD